MCVLTVRSGSANLVKSHGSQLLSFKDTTVSELVSKHTIKTGIKCVNINM